jgi:hypothetical protein
MTVPSTRSSDASRRGRLLIKLSPQQSVLVLDKDAKLIDHFL